MKKTIVVLCCIFIAIIVSLYTYYQNTQATLESVKKFNYQYEQYFEKEIYGSTVATIINQAIDNNAKYDISKDSKGRYIPDNEYCLKVLIKFKNVDALYEMESIYKAGVEGFMNNFGASVFKITDYEYNDSTKRIGKIIIEEIKIGNI